MRLTRRAFLQCMVSTLTALGCSDIGLSLFAGRYQQVLAQPTRRKLALLIGINQYPESVCDYLPTKGYALNGSLTDVALQQELLIHRFGFDPHDILLLTDHQATRQAIIDAFSSHIMAQARPDDVVVLHMSGLGSQVRLTTNPEDIHWSLVPVDGVLPTEAHPEIHDLLEETWELLVRSLPTTQVSTILDLSYGDGNPPLPGNLRVRSRPSTPTGSLDAAQLMLQETLRSQLHLRQEQLLNAPPFGMRMTAAGVKQVAIEGQWNGFNAGLFTYALTQQLWQITPPTTVRIAFGGVVRTITQLVGEEQQPRFNGQKGHEPSLTTYYLRPDPWIGADGVVTAMEEDGKTVQLWMGGLPPLVLDYYGMNSLLTLAGDASIPAETSFVFDPPVGDRPNPANLPPVVQIRSRDGLLFRARLTDSTLSTVPQIGQLVREQVRVLPRNISLIVALDNSLERIERVDATSAFATIPKVSAVVAGEHPADYVFGKTRTVIPTIAASLPSANIGESWMSSPFAASEPGGKGSYGLFNLGRAALPNTLGQEDEAVKTAISRLTPQLKLLLAMKLIRLTANAGASRLGVGVTLETVAPQEQILIQQDTVRAPWSRPDNSLIGLFASEGGIPALQLGNRIRYRLHNYSDRPVYFTLIGLDPGGNAIALYPPSPVSATVTDKEVEGSTLGIMVIPPATTVLFPQSPSQPEWVLNGTPGITETHLIMSCAPLTQTWGALTAIDHGRNWYRPAILSNPLDIAYALLQDLHNASTSILPKMDAAVDSYLLSMDAWATLTLIYRILPASSNP